jgi:hypothetical protein
VGKHNPGVRWMAYPDPTEELKGKQAVEFQKRLDNFKLSPKQKEFYKDAKKLYKKINEESSK